MEEKQTPTRAELVEIMALLGYQGLSTDAFHPFLSEEDGSEYAVWRVDAGDRKYVLKRAKGSEIEIYRSFFREKKPYVPAFFGDCEYAGDAYFLTEFCPGETLSRCDREKLTKALDALIMMQDEFWERADLYDAAYPFDEALARVERRGRFLDSALLERAYAAFSALYRSTPRTLCHDDLLPFNLLIGERAVLIDWECGGMLPYPASLARLLAHGREEEGAFFYLRRDDRDFAIDYYYENLVKKHGVSYADYRRTLDFFFFFEYCEWVMVGNRYGNRDDERYVSSLKLAEETATALLESKT